MITLVLLTVICVLSLVGGMGWFYFGRERQHNKALTAFILFGEEQKKGKK